MELSKQIARQIYRKPEPEEWLARWFTKKYQTPWNHELFQERTLLDLLVEYHLDVFDAKPLEVHRNADGEIQLQDTGDDLIDKWEQQIAEGDDVDLWEAFSPEAIEKIKQRLRNKRKVTTASMGDVVDQAQAQQAQIDRVTKKKPFNTFGDLDE